MFASQVTPAHGSTQRPERQTCECGQTTPLHGATQVPAMQRVPLAHVTLAHAGSLQRPLTEHACPTGHACSTQRSTHAPRSQTLPAAHRLLPLSTVPSQSLSRPSHVSAPEAVDCTQVSAPAWHCWMPAEQTPFLPVSHASPPPWQVMPV